MHRIIMLIAMVVGLPAAAMIAPPNKMRIYPNGVTEDRISKSNFNRAIDLVFNRYSPSLARQGWTLQFNRLWADPTVNSDTYQSGHTIVINSYGGLARHPMMKTVAEYALVACHELGHSLGGFPYYTGENLSVEGQADRWGAMRCMKAIGFKSVDAKAAALQLTMLLADLGGEEIPSIPGPWIPPYWDGIQEDHPPAQCRLDEMVGALSGKARNKCWYNP